MFPSAPSECSCSTCHLEMKPRMAPGRRGPGVARSSLPAGEHRGGTGVHRLCTKTPPILRRRARKRSVAPSRCMESGAGFPLLTKSGARQLLAWRSLKSGSGQPRLWIRAPPGSARAADVGAAPKTHRAQSSREAPVVPAVRFGMELPLPPAAGPKHAPRRGGDLPQEGAPG